LVLSTIVIWKNTKLLEHETLFLSQAGIGVSEEYWRSFHPISQARSASCICVSEIL
jgi:hypothetical protein